MPITYDIDDAGRIIRVRAYGFLTWPEVYRYEEEVLARPEWTAYDELFDASDVTEIEEISAGEMRSLAFVAAGSDVPGRPTRLAIVTPDDTLFGMGRMYGAYREMPSGSSKRVRVFRSRDDAIRWLEGEEDAGAEAELDGLG